MSDFFAQVERELSQAVARRAHLPWYRRGLRSLPGRLGRVRVASIALVIGGTSTAVALAASGVILTGSPVRTAGRPSATAGDGVPVPGGSKLLSLRTPDPEGGLPWGMRVSRTTRGQICAQIGRVENGELGELGIDGAFHDDGLFHPLPADALPDVAGGPFNSDCVMPGSTFSGDVVGLDRNAATAARRGTRSWAGLREISYGLLGPHALSITYRAAAATLAGSASPTRTEPVIPGLGAYLIVQRYTGGHALGSAGESAGNEQPYDSFPAAPDGALTAIAYRFGKTCTYTGHGAFEGPCGLSSPPPPHPPALPAVRPALHARILVHRHTLAGAEISFRAPYPVKSAHEGYELFMPSCPGLSGGSSDSDIARGAVERIHLDPVSLALAFSCRRAVTVRVEYFRTVYGLPAPTSLGTISLREPPGTHTIAVVRVTAHGPRPRPAR